MARLVREMTQGELAGVADTTQGRLSKIEHGLLEPTTDLVDRLAKELDYPRTFFFQEGHMFGLPVRYHRRRQSLPAKTLERIHAEINIRTLHIGHLLKSAEFDFDRPIPQIDVDESGSPEDIARAVRVAWSVPRGPIPNLIELVEQAGIIVVPCEFGVREVDAIGQRVRGLPPLIFVNSGVTTDRLRFTLAHEIAHLVMHTLPNPEMEQQAQRFAAEFLMPEADIRHHLGRVTLPVLASLKPVWRVSMGAILEHAKRLRRVTERQYRSLRVELSSRGYTRREPGELDLAPEPPSLLMELIDFHAAKLGYTVAEISKILRIHPHEFQRAYRSQRFGIQLVG